MNFGGVIGLGSKAGMMGSQKLIHKKYKNHAYQVSVRCLSYENSADNGRLVLCILEDVWPDKIHLE